MILGVCNWLGYKFNTDPTIFRILFVVASIVYGTGLLLYFALWILKSILGE
ncbi:MAG: PspC domain-containing protein [Flavobacteriales bacterium]|nr:PspC domain-containing protein [Flavobacteriales bacterium]